MAKHFIESVEKFYVGYYHNKNYSNPILLAVSYDLNVLKYYMSIIRNLNKNQYSISEGIMDGATIHSLYSDYFIQGYSKDFEYLTERDIIALSKEKERNLENYVNMYSSFKEYLSLVNPIRKFSAGNDILNNALLVMRDQMSNTKALSKISSEMDKQSLITSPNIDEYISYMNIVEEEKSLVAKFYRNLELN